MASWSDIVPRVGTAYDLFGDGKTALKVSINKYVIAQGLQGTYGDTANPVNRLANIVTRMLDRSESQLHAGLRSDQVLAQDLRAAGGDLCGVVSDTNFGKPTLSLNYDPAVLNGWGTRPYQWEFSASVQRQLTQRVVRRRVPPAVVRQLRRDGQSGLTAADYSKYSVTAPLDPRLPNGGGYAVGPIYDINPNKVTVPQNNYFTLASNSASRSSTGTAST